MDIVSRTLNGIQDKGNQFKKGLHKTFCQSTK